MSFIAVDAVVLSVAPALACDDIAPYCDPVDGTIHDGTGTGTLPQVPGDPSPNASGIWLGHTLSARYCYGDRNRYIIDADQDWLDDTCELGLARAFAPALMMHPQDGCPTGEPYWAAKYFNDESVRYVRIAYMLGYYNDCGQAYYGFGAGHAGDSEYIMLGIQYNETTQHWQTREAYLSAHAGELTDSSSFITDPGLLEYPMRQLAYPRIWIARAKHANYRSQDECGAGAWGFDECRGEVAVGRVRIYRHRNAGSRHVDMFPNGVMAENPALRDAFRTEFFYTSRKFRGWQPNFPDGVNPYAEFLTGPRFECAKGPLELMSSCHWGQGPTPPTSYELSGVIDGPQQVTAYQANTWSSFVTGGQLAFTGTWWRRYTSDPAPVLVGTTTGSPLTAGSITFAPDRCESFTLTLTVVDTSGQSFTDTHQVSVTCPPPPLSVYIDGPGVIEAKGTYTFTAVTTGASGPTYYWSERFCDDQAGTSCTGWVGVAGLGDTYTRTLNRDCAGTGEKTFWLHVLVTNNNGQTTESERWTSLCAPA